MTNAKQLLRKAFGGSKNIITPYILRVGLLHPRIAYELSTDDRYLAYRTLYGVTVVRDDGEDVQHLYDHSRAFPTREAAEAYLQELSGRVQDMLDWQDPFALS